MTCPRLLAITGSSPVMTLNRCKAPRKLVQSDILIGGRRIT